VLRLARAPEGKGVARIPLRAARSAASCFSAMRLSHSYADRLKGQSSGLGERDAFRSFCERDLFEGDFRGIAVPMHRFDRCHFVRGLKRDRLV